MNSYKQSIIVLLQIFKGVINEKNHTLVVELAALQSLVLLKNIVLFLYTHRFSLLSPQGSILYLKLSSSVLALR